MDSGHVTGQPHLGAPRLVWELRKLGIDVVQSTVEKYRVRSRMPHMKAYKA